MAKSTKKSTNGKKNIMKKITAFFLKMFLFLFIGSVAFVVLYRFVPVYFTPLMFVRIYEQIQNDKKIKLDRDWEPLENISSNLVLAVISSEDQKFTEHNGFDFDAMKKAFKNNKKGKKIKGGSTITQQLAKNVFLWQGKSYIRKGLEAYFTFLIELIWSKERIMEVYLNIIEMGNGVYGAEAASHYYFKHSASNLTKYEAAWMASILPNPLRYDPNNPTSFLRKRQRFVLRQMRNLEGFKLKED